MAIVGSSGSGKTTLLRIMAGIDSFGGQVLFRGRPLEDRALAKDLSWFYRHIGFVFQESFLLGNFDAAFNLGMPLRLAGKDEPAIKREVQRLLGRLGIEAEGNKKSDHLSGGERQRVAIGRAVIHRPQIVFADEPTGSLDRENASSCMELLLECCDAVNAALILITHNMDLARDYCSEHYILTGGKLHPTSLRTEH